MGGEDGKLAIDDPGLLVALESVGLGLRGDHLSVGCYEIEFRSQGA